MAKQKSEPAALEPASGTELVAPSPVPAGLAQYVSPSEEVPAELGALTAPDRIPRLTLAQGQMEAILQRRAVPGDYLLSGDPERNLGPRVECFVAAWRPKALHLVNEEAVAESYDPRSPTFAEIVRRGATEEKTEGVRFLHGPEFLLWVPAARAWGTFLFGGTARERGRQAYLHLGAGMALGSESRSSKRFTWLIATVGDAEVTLPNVDEAALAREAFLAPVVAAARDAQP